MLSFHLLAHSHLHTYTWIFFSSTLVRTCSSAHLYPNVWTGPPMQCNVLRQCTEMFGCSTALINCTDQLHCSTALFNCTDQLHWSTALFNCTDQLHCGNARMFRCRRVRAMFGATPVWEHIIWCTAAKWHRMQEKNDTLSLCCTCKQAASKQAQPQPENVWRAGFELWYMYVNTAARRPWSGFHHLEDGFEGGERGLHVSTTEWPMEILYWQLVN